MHSNLEVPKGSEIHLISMSMAKKQTIITTDLLPFHDLPEEVPHDFREVVLLLTTPKIGETAGEKIIRFERISVISQMIRDRWCSSFRPLKGYGQDRKYLKTKSRLFNTILDLLQEIDTLARINYASPSQWLVLIISELQIDVINLRVEKSSGEIQQPDRKTICRTHVQHQNRQIKNLENPFSERLSPHTYEFLEKSRNLASTMNNFQTNYYTPFRQSREELTSYLIKNSSVFKQTPEGFKESRLGRPPKKKSPQQQNRRDITSR